MTTNDPESYPPDPNHAFDPRYAYDPNYPYVAHYPNHVWEGWQNPQAAAPTAAYAPPPPARTHRGRTAALVTGAAVLIAGATAGGIALSDAGSGTITGSGSNPTLELPGTSGGSTNGGTSGGTTGGGTTGQTPGGNGSYPFPGGGTGTGGGTGSGGSTGSGTAASATQSTGIVTIVSVLKYQNAESAGTGMVLTSNGEILTNNHVIRGATSITVRVVSTGKTYKADVVGTAPTKDVAVIQLRNASGLQTAKVGSSSDVSALSQGTKVTGVGNAGGTGRLTAASGSVTALRQSITASDDDGSNPEKLSGLIAINAGIVAGDSGGPLYDSNGDIVGIDTAAAQSNTGASAAYAIPITEATQIADEIENGVQTSSIHLGLPGFIGVGVGDTNGSGASITSVLQGGPADTAGITAGSVITSVGGRTIGSSTALQSALQARKPGSSVSIGWTDATGQAHHATVTLMTGPAD